MLWWAISFWEWDCRWLLLSVFILFSIGQIFFTSYTVTLAIKKKKEQRKRKQSLTLWSGWQSLSLNLLTPNMPEALCWDLGLYLIVWFFMWYGSVYCLGDRNTLKCLNKDQTHLFFQNLYLINSTKVQVKVIPQTSLF